MKEIATSVSGEGSQVDTEQTAFAITRRDQFVAVTLAVAVIVAGAVVNLKGHYVEPVSASPPANSDTPRWAVDINTATRREFTVLRGIGPIVARQIVEDRNTNGPFDSVESLQRVPGIGPRTIEKNRERLRATVTLEETRRVEKPRKDSAVPAE